MICQETLHLSSKKSQIFTHRTLVQFNDLTLQELDFDCRGYLSFGLVQFIIEFLIWHLSQLLLPD